MAETKPLDWLLAIWLASGYLFGSQPFVRLQAIGQPAIFLASTYLAGSQPFSWFPAIGLANSSKALC